MLFSTTATSRIHRYTASLFSTVNNYSVRGTTKGCLSGRSVFLYYTVAGGLHENHGKQSKTGTTTYCIRVRLIFYTVFTQVFTVFSDFHCKTHGFFSVYFRFRKPASPDQSVYELFCVRYARSTDGGRLITVNNGVYWLRCTDV
jgi:hypothetical protein